MTVTDRKDAGFTLVEVLIALVAAVLVLGVVLAGLRLTAKLREAGQRAVANNIEYQTSTRVLRRLVGRAFPVAFGKQDSARYVFAGTPTSLRFVTMMPGYPGQPGPDLFVLDQTASGGTTNLRLRRTPLPVDEDPLKTSDFAEDLILVRGPLQIDMSYFRGARGNKPGAWLDGWDDANDFPRLIRLRVVKTGPRRQIWPDIVIRLAINMDGACVLARKAAGQMCRLDREATP